MCINVSFAQENNNCLFGFCLGSKPSEIKNISIVQNQDQKIEKIKQKRKGEKGRTNKNDAEQEAACEAIKKLGIDDFQ